jgi:transformer-2 protein
MSSRRRHVGNRDNPCPGRCLGVFGLSICTSEQQLYHIFSKYGPVERVVVVIKETILELVILEAF